MFRFSSCIALIVRLCLAFFCAVLFAAASTGQTVEVDGPDALNAALATAPEGSTIALAPGQYGALRLEGDIGASVIRSVDPDQPARFSEVEVSGVEGLSFEYLVFDYTFAPGDRIFERPFVWHDSRDLALRNNVFDGDVAHGVSAIDDGYGYTLALTVRSSEDVLVEGNTIFDFWKAMHFTNVRNLVVRGNDVSRIRSDGLNFAQVAHVLVEGNHIHSFNRSLELADHADMIQLWSRDTEWPSHDVTFRANVLNSTGGLFTQSIFVRNERADTQGSTDESLFYRGITISDNIIINAHLHGISVGETIGLTVERNTVVQNPASATDDPSHPVHIPRIGVAEVSRNVRILDNIVAQVGGYEGQSDWEVDGNLEAQNISRSSPGFYSDVFVGQDWGQIESYTAAPGGPADRDGLGSNLLR